MKRPNKGEVSEIITKQRLFTEKNNPAFLVSIFGNNARDGIEIINPTNGLPCDDIRQITKAKSNAKADIIILYKFTNQMRYCSITPLVI